MSENNKATPIKVEQSFGNENNSKNWGEWTFRAGNVDS